MSQHAFSPGQNTQLSPGAWYGQLADRPGFIADPAQAEAIGHLDRLYFQLLEFKKRRGRFLGKSLRNPVVPRGLYFWGGVGRGKSFLMDAFYACVPYRRKRRVHFHQFMMEVHAELRTLSNEADPLVTVARRIAERTRLLCFDEFHVSDIADAMILGRLLKELFGHGVVFVMTSNYEPDGLYPNGLQRMNFLPTIALIKEWMDVLNVDGGRDYRHRELTREPLYVMPLAGSEARLEEIWNRLAPGKPLKNEITLFGRKLNCVRHASGMIWFDFMEICAGPRAQTDYVEIARAYHTVFVSGMPKLGAAQASEARRFTWLVDVFYDSRVKLVMSAEVEPDALYTEGVQAGEFFRTASRLSEMQTSEYLALPHQGDPYERVPVGELAL